MTADDATMGKVVTALQMTLPVPCLDHYMRAIADAAALQLLLLHDIRELLIRGEQQE